MIGDIGVSAAAHESRQRDAEVDLMEMALATAYAGFADGPVWRDIRDAIDQQIADAETAIIEADSGQTIEKKRDDFVTFQAWKKMRVALTERVRIMSDLHQQFKEQTDNGNDTSNS